MTKKPKFWIVYEDDGIGKHKILELAIQDAKMLAEEKPSKTYYILEAIKEFRGNVVVREEELG